MSSFSPLNHTPIDVKHLSDTPSDGKFVTIDKNTVRRFSKSKTQVDIPNILLVFSVLLFVGSFSFSLNTMQQQNTSNTRASANNLPTAGPTSVPLPTFATYERKIVSFATSIPRSYKGNTIPSSLFTEGMTKYAKVPKKYAEDYVKNRIMSYYVFTDVLNEAQVEYETAPSDLTYEFIETEYQKLQDKMLENVVSTADYAVMRTYTNYTHSNTNPKKKYGDKLQAKAKEKIEEYRTKMIENPENIEVLMKQSEKDADIIALNNYESGLVIRKYFADLNDYPEQSSYIFSEEFDTFLFDLPVKKVSAVKILDKENPYLMVVVYPYAIEKRLYPSFKKVFEEKESLFSF